MNVIVKEESNMTTYNFVPVTKAVNNGNRKKRPEPRQDTLRLTDKNFVVGRDLVNRFLRIDNRSVVTIEKDVMNRAFRIRVAKDNEPNTVRLFYSTGRDGLRRRNDLHTNRLKGFFDMPNGNYVEDIKEPGVFVLE